MLQVYRRIDRIFIFDKTISLTSAYPWLRIWDRKEKATAAREGVEGVEAPEGEEVEATAMAIKIRPKPPPILIR